MDLRSRLKTLSMFTGKTLALRGLPSDPSMLLSLSAVTNLHHRVVWVFWGKGIPHRPPVVVQGRITHTHTVTRLAKRDDRCARITHTPGATGVDDRNAFMGLLTKSDVRRALDVGKDLSKLNVEYIHVAGPC